MATTATLAAVLLLATVIRPSESNLRGDEKSHQSKKQLLSHAEKLGELYYQNQLKEREKDLPKAFIHLNPNYPCVHGVVPIGEDTPKSISDGHKFSCGIQQIKSEPIVYSFGSNQQQDFENGILHRRPDALIWTHDVLESHLPLVKDRISKVHYTATGLGSTEQNKDDLKFKLLSDFMMERGHTYIDILKVDIEGGEYSWIKDEPLDTFSRIGQLLIEVHRFQGYSGGKCVCHTPSPASFCDFRINRNQFPPPP